MTPADLRDWLARAGWSQRELARRLRVDERTVRHWVKPDGEVPGYCVAFCELWDQLQAVTT